MKIRLKYDFESMFQFSFSDYGHVHVFHVVSQIWMMLHIIVPIAMYLLENIEVGVVKPSYTYFWAYDMSSRILRIRNYEFVSPIFLSWKTKQIFLWVKVFFWPMINLFSKFGRAYKIITNIGEMFLWKRYSQFDVINKLYWNHNSYSVLPLPMYFYATSVGNELLNIIDRFINLWQPIK